jgi:hypothetical protein
MRAVFGNPQAVAREIGGHFCPSDKSADEYVQSPVGPVCKVLWPEKTDVKIAVICKCDPRNARRYMSGELPIPAVLLTAINVRLTERNK